MSLAFTLVAIAPAAAGTRYKRTAPVSVPVTVSERSRPRPPRAAPPTPAPIGADDALAIRGKQAPLREEQARLLKGLIAETSDAVELADLHFRLADLYLEDNRYHRLKATEATMGKGDPAAARDHAASARRSLREAIAALGPLSADARFRVYPRRDRALAALARARVMAGDAAAGRQVYKQLLDEHPQSPLAPDAYLAFADFFFSAGELDNARAFYDKVLAFPQSASYAYAGYKQGWVDVNQGRHEDAARRFLQVVRDTDGDAVQATLHRAATHDFVRAYAEFGKVDKAWAAFAKLDAAQAPTLYAALADLYRDQGKLDKAIYAYRQLMKASPGSDEVCAWQHEVARAMLAVPGATLDDRAAEIERLVALHGALARRTQRSPSAATACGDDAAAMSGELARAWHSEGVKTKDRALYAAADRLYGAYLAQFDDRADAAETAYYRAELAWVRADAEPDPRRQTLLWRDSAAAFRAVIVDPRTDAGRRQVAADAAMRAVKNMVDLDPRPRQAPVDADEDRPTPPPAEIPEGDRLLLAAFDDYLTHVTDPRDPERVEVTFWRGNTLRKWHHYDQAIPLLASVVKEHPEHEAALYAANALYDALIVTHRDADLATWARYVVEHPEFLTARADQDRSALGERARDIARLARRKEAEAIAAAARAKGDLGAFVACGKAYLDLFNAEPDAPRADELLWNAADCFEQGRSLSIAIETFTELRQRFPDSTHAARALARLGGVYARVAYYDRAAAMFEEYARRHAGAADAYDLMSDAVVYRKGTGADEEAVADTRYFVKAFGKGKPAEAAAAFYSLAAIYDKRGDRGAEIAHHREYLRRFRGAGGAARAVVSSARLGELLWQSGCADPTDDGACVRTERERAVASRGRRVRTGPRTQCGPDTRTRTTVIARDAAAVRQARAALDDAIAAYTASAGRFGADEAVARHAYAQARFYLAEIDYEAYLASGFPTGLSFDRANPAVAARSMKKFESWFAAKEAAAARLSAQYVALVKDVRDPATAIAAAARFGQTYEAFADALYTAPIPAEIRRFDDAADEYCAALEDKVVKPAEAAVVGFERCLKASTDFGWFSSWSRLCERELGQLRPEAYPTAAELRAAPDAAVRVTDVEPMVARLE